MKKFLLTIAVLVLLWAVGFGVFFEPLLYTLTPLQRYYLGTYLGSSWKAKDPGAMTEVRWIEKIRPMADAPPTMPAKTSSKTPVKTPVKTPAKKGAKKPLPQLDYALAKEDDVLPVPAMELLWKGDRLPFLMTRQAEVEGWSTIVFSPRSEMHSAQIEDLLRRDFFGDEPPWRFFVQPAVLLVIGLFFFLLWRRRRNAWWERNWWKRSVPLWKRVALLDSPVFGETPSAAPLSLPAKVIEGERVEPKTSPPAPVPTAVAAAAQVKPKPVVWDETQGIE